MWGLRGWHPARKVRRSRRSIGRAEARMIEIRISPGVRVAWQIAGDFALEYGAKEIEPLHLLFGVCGVETQLRAPAGDGSLPKATADEYLQGEIAALCALFREFGEDPNEIRLRIRSFMASGAAISSGTVAPGSRRVSRSSASRALFDVAARRSNDGVVDLMELAATICMSRDPDVQLAFGKEAETIAALAQSYSTTIRAGKPGGVLAGIESLYESGAATDSGADITVLETIDAGKRVDAQEVRERFTALCELAWESGTEGPLEAMLQNVLKELLRLVPAAERGAILFRDRASGAWMLNAHSSAGTPRLSMTSVRQACEQKKGFHWRKGDDLSRSQKEENLEGGIYAPMLANDEVFGVVCLDSSKSEPAFGRSDLELVIAMAHQLGLAIANRELRRELTTNAKVMERLMTNFSPMVRTRLLQRARQGRLRLGGERTTVTILCSDIRGFTRLAAKMEAEDVVDMLNDYFSALIDPIFHNDGTIDKFIGDAILAVFGSPEADPDHCRKAVIAAVKMQEAARAVSEKRSARGQPCCEIGIGLHFGEVIHGFIGSNSRMEYTVIGDAVNLAARFCDGAKGGEVLLSQELMQRVWESVQAAKTAISTKHEGELTAYRMERLRGD